MLTNHRKWITAGIILLVLSPIVGILGTVWFIHGNFDALDANELTDPARAGVARRCARRAVPDRGERREVLRVVHGVLADFADNGLLFFGRRKPKVLAPTEPAAAEIDRLVGELVAAIEDYIQKHNENPQPFIWTAQVQDLLEKVRRARAVLDKMASA